MATTKFIFLLRTYEYIIFWRLYHRQVHIGMLHTAFRFQQFFSGSSWLFDGRVCSHSMSFLFLFSIRFATQDCCFFVESQIINVLDIFVWVEVRLLDVFQSGFSHYFSSRSPMQAYLQQPIQWLGEKAILFFVYVKGKIASTKEAESPPGHKCHPVLRMIGSWRTHLKFQLVQSVWNLVYVSRKRLEIYKKVQYMDPLLIGLMSKSSHCEGWTLL